MRTIVIAALSASLFFAAAVPSRSQTAPASLFRIEIKTDTTAHPTFMVTNLSNKSLTACSFRFTVSSEGRPQGGMDWDAIVQDGGPLRPDRPVPLEPQATMTLYRPHRVGGPVPDKVEAVAGIWSDGETFGDSKCVKTLLDGRTSTISAYERAISLFKKRLAEHWTSSQYLAALDTQLNATPSYAIRSTLQANTKRGEDPRSVQLAMHSLLEYFTQTLTPLRPAKSPTRASRP